MGIALGTLDALIVELREAVAANDLEALAHIDGRVRSCVDDAIAAMRAGDIAEETMRDRLTTLQALTSQASGVAAEARASAKSGLKEVGRNQSAASKYADISGRGPR